MDQLSLGDPSKQEQDDEAQLCAGDYGCPKTKKIGLLLVKDRAKDQF